MKNTELFDASLAIDALDHQEIETLVRRMQTYSVEALRDAVAVERVFVAYPKFVTVVRMVDRLFQLGTELETPQGACLIGPSGVGKTAVFKYFLGTLPNSSLFEPGTGAVGIRIRRIPMSGHIIRALLRALAYPFSSGSNKQLYARRDVVFEAIKSKGTRLVWIDEAQHLIPRRQDGSIADHEGDASEFLGELIDFCRVSVVLSGSDELDDLPKSLPHLASRICGRETLSEFALNTGWVAFLTAFSKQITLVDFALICDRSVAMQMHKATAGNLRKFRQLMVEATLIARDAEQKRIDIPTLKTAYRRVFGEDAARSCPFV